MSLDKKFLEILVCPTSKQALRELGVVRGALPLFWGIPREGPGLHLWGPDGRGHVAVEVPPQFLQELLFRFMEEMYLEFHGLSIHSGGASVISFPAPTCACPDKELCRRRAR